MGVVVVEAVAVVVVTVNVVVVEADGMVTAGRDVSGVVAMLTSTAL